jgi:hypothetical protein
VRTVILSRSMNNASAGTNRKPIAHPEPELAVRACFQATRSLRASLPAGGATAKLGASGTATQQQQQTLAKSAPVTSLVAAPEQQPSPPAPASVPQQPSAASTQPAPSVQPPPPASTLSQTQASAANSSRPLIPPTSNAAYGWVWGPGSLDLYRAKLPKGFR